MEEILEMEDVVEVEDIAEDEIKEIEAIEYPVKKPYGKELNLILESNKLRKRSEENARRVSVVFRRPAYQYTSLERLSKFNRKLEVAVNE